MNYLVFQPVYKLYSLVWWKNQPESQICATLSPGTTTVFWEKHKQECTSIIYTQFQSIYTSIISLSWFYMLYQIYLMFWHICIVSRTQRYILRHALQDATKTILRDIYKNPNLHQLLSQDREYTQIQDDTTETGNSNNFNDSVDSVDSDNSDNSDYSDENNFEYTKK